MSFLSIVFDGVYFVVNVDEFVLICDKFNDYYFDVKVYGEVFVLSVNGRNFVICVICFSGIFGFGDRLMVFVFVKFVRVGKLKFIFGDGKNMFDWMYVENVVYVYLCVEKVLLCGDSGGEFLFVGKVFFIIN